MSVDSRIGAWRANNDGTATGQQSSPPGAFTPTTLSAHSGSYSARTWGSGFATWAALRVELEVSAAGNCAYNASRYTGISFWAKSGRNFGTPVGVAVATPATVGTAYGGSCLVNCFDYHTFNFVPTTGWVHYQVPWATLQQEGYGTPAVFDSAMIMFVEFGFAAFPFDFYVDDLSFY